ncbi:60S large subunit ribosomal protein eL34 (rpL34) [Andalucia godoyi]|uniref:60S large subunit ribosomal protein eL34 (RpL34) n=1 Tax=Andalucia godoyi TaxID=505711 RepID=A0A8K0F217_ANDGO|nr:60S large subunit ribosomal protein eL34 (rpL34) [Andalucia godoyi]|eukprot:ANDGO_06215.mRNA.1 60S large subunit ribosomal protein eL34 (rpL34)
MLDTRVTYRRRHSYNTAANATKVVKTPGGRLVVQYLTKASKGVHAPHNLGGQALQGLKRLRPSSYSRLGKSAKTVARPYGGVLTGGQVRERVLRAFLVEEAKLVKKVLKDLKDKQSKDTKKEKKPAAAAAASKAAQKPKAAPKKA